MFEHRKQPLPPSAPVLPPKEGLRIDRLNHFLDLYIRVRKGADWNSARLAAGKDISADLPAFRKVEATMDACWDVLNDQERAEALRALVKAGLVDELVLEAMARLDAVPSKVNAPPLHSQPKASSYERDKVFTNAKNKRNQPQAKTPLLQPKEGK